MFEDLSVKENGQLIFQLKVRNKNSGIESNIKGVFLSGIVPTLECQLVLRSFAYILKRRTAPEFSIHTTIDKDTKKRTFFVAPFPCHHNEYPSAGHCGTTYIRRRATRAKESFPEEERQENKNNFSLELCPSGYSAGVVLNDGQRKDPLPEAGAAILVKNTLFFFLLLLLFIPYHPFKKKVKTIPVVYIQVIHVFYRTVETKISCRKLFFFFFFSWLPS